MERVFIHDLNLYNGWSIGDLFSSIINYRFTNKNDLIVVTHKSLHTLTLFLFGDFVKECSDILTSDTKRIHIPFTDTPRLANTKITINYNTSILDSIPNDELLPENSIVLLLNRSDNYVLPHNIINDILSVCKGKNTFIRNVIDNKKYTSSYLTLDIPEYTYSLMSLLKSCIQRNVKIIMQRAGICEVFAYTSTNPIFIIYPTTPASMEDFTFSDRYTNEFIKPTCKITEYLLKNYDTNEFTSKLRDFVE